MPTGVLKVRVGGVWQNIGSAGIYAHHALHEPGGADALTVLNAGILTQGTLPDGRLSINVLKYAGGFPGGTTNFLRADGTFAPAGVGNTVGPGSSATDDLAAFADTTGKLLKDSGIPLSTVARLDRSVTFAGGVTGTALSAASTGYGSLVLQQTDGPANAKIFQLFAQGGVLTLRSLNDAFSTQQGSTAMDTAGNFSASSNITAANAVKIGTPGGWPSIQFLNSYLTFHNSGGTQLMWLNESGILQLNFPSFRFSTSTLEIQNSTGTACLTVRSDGAVFAPYFLVIPFGTDRWAPA